MAGASARFDAGACSPLSVCPSSPDALLVVIGVLDPYTDVSPSTTLFLKRPHIIVHVRTYKRNPSKVEQ